MHHFNHNISNSSNSFSQYITNPQIATTNANKPKPRRSRKIIIRDPKGNKDVTDEILSIHNNTANGRPGGTPPLTTSTDQTTMQAQFAAQVAARVGEKRTQVSEEEEYDMIRHGPWNLYHGTCEYLEVHIQDK